MAMLLIPVLLKSQDTTNYRTEKETEKFSSLMCNGSFTNNNLEYLVGITEKIPTIFSDATYFHKTGLYCGGGISNYLDDTLQSSDYDIEAGYQKYFDNGFDIDISYTWHRFSGNDLLQGIDYNHAFDLMLSYDLNNTYLTSDFYYLAGPEPNNYFFDFDIARFITFDEIFSKHDVFMFNPAISFSFGTDHWIYEDMDAEEKSVLLSNLSSAGYAYETFSYQGINFFLPLSYGIKNFYISLSGLYRVPGGKFKYLGWEPRFGFMVSLTYFLNFLNQ